MRSGFEADRAGRFNAENTMRSGFDSDRAARFGAEDAARVGYETEEASRLRQQQTYQGMAPMVQGLREQTAAGLITTGEAKRKLTLRQEHFRELPTILRITDITWHSNMPNLRVYGGKVLVL